MADKSWMLNPKAIRHANDCIHIVKSKKGIRLKLSQADFMSQLHSYVESISSKELGESYSKLLSMAGVGAAIREINSEPAQAISAMAVGADTIDISSEMIDHNGESYPRYRNGREFKGLHHGLPRYR